MLPSDGSWLKKVNMDHREFSLRLAEIRHHLGWTYDDIANITHVSRRMVVAYELGDTPPSFKFLSALMQAGVDVAYLITGRSSQPLPPASVIDAADGASRLMAAMQPVSTAAIPCPENERALLDGFRQLAPKDQRKLLNVLWRLQAKAGNE
ncbi:MAG: Helix-turn-helix domain [Pseudomonadota bacterium]